MLLKLFVIFLGEVKSDSLKGYVFGGGHNRSLTGHLHGVGRGSVGRFTMDGCTGFGQNLPTCLI